jgi:DNA-binding response OmpR family regulator
VTVVNDRPEFLELMREILEPAGHLVSTLTGDGLGVDQLAATEPDLLIIDLRLDPDRTRLTGWDFIVLARADDRTSAVPIVLCSADQTGTRDHGDELQALADVHVMLKPFAVAEMEELVRRLLAREPEPVAMLDLPEPAPPP